MSLQDTNIIKSVMSSTSLRKNGINIPLMHLVAISDKRKWDTLVEESKEYGDETTNAMLSRPDVLEAVKALQDDVVAKKPRIQEGQAVVANLMRDKITPRPIAIAASAAKLVGAYKKSANTAKKQQAMLRHDEDVRALMMSDMDIDQKMMEYQSLKNGLQEMLKTDTSFVEE